VKRLALLLVAASCCGATREVGSGKTYATITDAITAASAGDTISVFNGTYAETISLSKSNLTISAAAGNAPEIAGRITASAQGFTLRGMIVRDWTGLNNVGVRVDGQTNATIENCEFRNGPEGSSAIYIRNTGGVLIRSNTTHHCATGINIVSGRGSSYATGTRIENNLVVSNWFDGMDLHGRYLTVTGNTIYRNFDTNWVANHPDGIQLIDSTVDSQQGCQEVIIARNRIYSHPQNVFVGWYTTNLVVANNVMDNEAGVVSGVDLDSATTKHVVLMSGTNLLVANNTFGRCGNSGVYLVWEADKWASARVLNNVTDGVFGGGLAVYAMSTTNIVELDYNLYGTNNSYAVRVGASYYTTAATARAATAYEDHGIDGNPLLSSYVPQAGSPALNAGITLSEFSDDYTGATRAAPWDIGAYELIHPTASAGTVTVGSLIIAP